MSQIVRALPEHIEPVMQICRELHADKPLAPLCEETMRGNVLDFLTTGLCLLSITAANEVAGILAFARGCPTFSREEWLIDRALFVRPRFRRESHCRDLVRAALAEREHRNIPMQFTLVGVGHRTAGIIKLLSKELGEPTGALWCIRAAGKA